MDHPEEIKLKKLLAPLEEEMEFFLSSFFGASYPSIYRKEICWKPHTDVYETDSDFVVILDLAQVDPDEVSLTFQKGVLYIRGIRKAIPPSERRRYHKMEIDYGPFERKIAIVEQVDVQSLSAVYKDGFLEVKLPKKSSSSGGTREIEVE